MDLLLTALNRTILELKRNPKVRFGLSEGALNRTILELKHNEIEAMGRQLEAFESHHFGIETIGSS